MTSSNGAAAIQVTTGTMSLNNSGYIGSTFSSDNVVMGGGGNDDISNSGTIAGGVSLGAGNDVFNALGGKVFDDIVAGDGDDRLVIRVIDPNAPLLEFRGDSGADTVDLGRFGSAVWVDLDYGGVEVWTKDDMDLASSSPWRTLADLSDMEHIIGSASSDYLSGNASNNTFVLTDGRDQVFGEGGIDTLDAGAFSSAVWIDLQYIDETWTRDTSSVIVGTWRKLADLTSIETITATPWADELFGDAGANTFRYGGLGVAGAWDIVNGRGGVDTYDASTLTSAAWIDLLYAGREVQTFTGGVWKELADLTSIENLIGSTSADTIYGDDVANRIEGRKGADDLRGRGGADTFVFNLSASELQTSAQCDTIRDFVAGTDKIGITGLDALPIISIAPTPITGVSATLLFDTDTGVLSFDADGQGTGSPVEIAILLGNPVISSGDILLL